MEKLNFLYTADTNYFNHMLTSIYSLLLHHLTDSVTIHIIEEGFIPEQFFKLEKLQKEFPNVEIRIYSLNKLNNIMDKMHIPKYRDSHMPNARLFASEIIDVKKLLYLDSDTIVKGNLANAFCKNNNSPISAVKEVDVPMHVKSVLNYYYNSGVLLLDFDEWAKEDYFKKIYETICRFNQTLKLPDQDIINIAFDNQIATLDFSYNIFPNVYNFMLFPLLAKHSLQSNTKFYSYDEVAAALADPKVFHLLTVYKCRPWEKNKINPFNDLYDYYRKIWDPNFEKPDSKRLLANFSLLPYLDAINNGLLGSENYHELKEKVNSLILKLR